MFRPVSTKPDLVAQEHELLARWREHRTFDRLRAQNAGGPRWSFLDGPITANNPMGVHHAWGRTYKDVFQRYHAMLGENERWQNGFDCQGLWVEVNVERDLGFTSKRDIEAYGIAEFVSLCKQRVLTYAARQTEQSIRLGMWMDWDDPDELRRLRDALAADPSQVLTITGPSGPLTDTAEMLVGRLGPPGARRQLLHVQQREQRPHLGLPGGVPPPRLDLQGPRLDAVVPAMRDGPLADGDERGLRRPRGPGTDRPLPAGRPVRARRSWSGRRRRGRSPRTSRPPSIRNSDTSRFARATTPSGSARGPSSGRSSASSRSRTRRPGRSSSGGRYTGPFDDLPRRPGDVRRGAATTTAWCPGTTSARTRGPASSTSRPGAGAEDFQLGKSLGLPVIGPIDEEGRYYEGFGWLSRLDAPQRRAGDHRRPRAARLLLPPRAVQPPLPALLAVQHAAPVPPRRRVVHQHGPGLRQAALGADAGGGRREPALPDHGGRRPDPLAAVVRLRAGARLADEHARLDDQQEALLGAGAADLRLPGLRHDRGDRRARGARRAGRSRAGRRSRATRRIGRTSTR